MYTQRFLQRSKCAAAFARQCFDAHCFSEEVNGQGLLITVCKNRLCTIKMNTPDRICVRISSTSIQCRENIHIHNVLARRGSISRYHTYSDLGRVTLVIANIIGSDCKTSVTQFLTFHNITVVITLCYASSYYEIVIIARFSVYAINCVYFAIRIGIYMIPGAGY